MQFILTSGVLLLSYLIGSIPFGLIIVHFSAGKDIRKVESGRTGGTNAMRAAGLWAGLATAFLDMMKSASTVWITRALLPGHVWVEVFAPILAILGHNYSIFLMEREAGGRLRLRGGAGGAPAAGGALGLWLPSILFIIPAGALIVFGIGYASLATLSTPLIAAVIFAIRAVEGVSPWQYVLYGLFAELLLIWALRPNIRRLIEGKERLVGWRAKRLKKAEERNYSSSSSSSSSSS